VPKRRSARSSAVVAAVWLIGWRMPQAIGGSMLNANSVAILTDAFPADQRGFALGIDQVAGPAGQFIALVAGVRPARGRASCCSPCSA
jgi:MFS family permease